MKKIYKWFSIHTRKIFFILFSAFFVWIYIIHSNNAIADILFVNENVLVDVFVIVVLPSIWIYFFLKFFSKTFSLGTFVAVVSIIAALVFFMVQNYQEYFARLIILQHITSLNCEDAKNIANENPNEMFYPQQHFNYDIYQQDLDFISENFSTQTLYATQNAITYMNIANTDMDTGSSLLTQNNLNVTPQQILINNSIIAASKAVFDTTNCEASSTIFSINGEYINATVPSVFLNLFKGLFRIFF